MTALTLSGCGQGATSPPEGSDGGPVLADGDAPSRDGLRNDDGRPAGTDATVGPGAGGDGPSDASAQSTSLDAWAISEGASSSHGPADLVPSDSRTTEPGVPQAVLIAGGLPQPFGVAVDPMTGQVYSADHGDGRVRRIDAQGQITIVVGPGAAGSGGRITMDRPHDLLFQPGTRNLFIADTYGGRVLRMNVSDGEVTVFAGGGAKIPAGGKTFCLAFDAAGTTLYFTGGGGIRVVNLKTETLEATISYANPRVITVDSRGTLYAVEINGTVLQTVDASGRATDVPGGSPLAAPKRITTDQDDNVIIVDTESHSILKYVLATKSLVRLAGNGTPGPGRLDGPAAQAQTNRPHGAFVDASGRILIADSANDRIFAITF